MTDLAAPVVNPQELLPVIGRASRALWRDLHRCIAIGALWVLLSLPTTLLAIFGKQSLAVICLLLPLAGLSGLNAFLVGIKRDEHPKLSSLLRVDVSFALSAGALFATCFWLFQQPLPLAAAGYLLFAFVLVLLPFCVAYGGIRGTRGLGNWRAAIILSALAPTWSLTLLALSAIGFFLVFATGGVLIIAVPAWIFLIAIEMTDVIIFRKDEQ